jgi:signal transduction histidine kinase
MSRLLIIEDEKELRESIAEMLELEGYTTIQAENGTQGIEQAKSSNPDLIICDIMMPDMDGFSVLRKLHEDKIFTLTPFIFITALSERKYQRKGIELGADDFLIKPFSREELINAINIKLRKKETIAKESERHSEELRKNIIRSLPHELQTPLNAILGFSQIISDEVTTMSSVEIAELANLIYKSGNELHKIIPKYLLYIDLEVEHTKCKLSYFKTPSAVILPIIRKLSEKYGRPDDVQQNLEDAPVNLEENRFGFAFTELLDNAFKFSKAGSPIAITTAITENTLTFSISDKGRGFTPPSWRDIKAFDQFNRNTYEQQGTGLGLYLAKQIIEQHAGTFNVNSEPGAGTTISFRLPIAI